jgi:hypothetical protein
MARRRVNPPENGAYLDVSLAEGGAVVPRPVEIFRVVRLAKQGLADE